MVNSAHWYGHVLRREDDHVLRRALDFEVEGQRDENEAVERQYKDIKNHYVM